MRGYRWRRIAMVFQAAMNSLDPVHRVGQQVIEAIEAHGMETTMAGARERVARLFQMVGLDPQLMERYPHEFSGGMRQRAVIAMALSCDPDLIIADEPTTALDVIVQDRILRELKQVQQELRMGMIYISHDIGVVAEGYGPDRGDVRRAAGGTWGHCRGVSVADAPLHGGADVVVSQHTRREIAAGGPGRRTAQPD